MNLLDRIRPGGAASTPDGIPGLRGAPMRTPVRSTGGRAGPGLWPAMAGAAVMRQLWIELYGLPGYPLTLKRRVSGFAASPRDIRPLESKTGADLLKGRFNLAGTRLETPAPDTPWERPSPSRAFAVELHAFTWLPALMNEGAPGAAEALRLSLAWGRVFARWSPFAWAPDIMARRVMALAAAGRRMAAEGDEPQVAALADLTARQARQLLRPPGRTAGQAARLAAVAVAGCALAGPSGEALRRAALKRLPRALTREVHEDGACASRSPEAGLELLLDLLAVEAGLGQLGETTPPALTEAIDRLRSATAFFTLPDRRLAAFQGGGGSTPARIAAALPDPDPATAALRAGDYARIASPLMTLIADVGAPAGGAFSDAACAHPLAIEIVCGRDRLITGCGWTPSAADRQGLRLTPGHSTLTLGEISAGEPLGGRAADWLGPRLISPIEAVRVEHREGDGAVWLEAEHDGWAAPHGLTHQRRLYLDQRLDELRAEDRLFPTEGRSEAARAIAAPYAVRFHLEPGVQASLARDRRSILLRGQSGRGWWFRTDGPDVAIEPSVRIDGGLSRRSLQIVVRGSARTDGETRIRWKLGPAGGAEDPH